MMITSQANKLVKVERPALRYHGGKWILAEWIISQFPKHRIYVEPFGGAASVLLQKGRSYAEVYNDLDSELVNFFQIVRDRGEELRRVLTLTPFARVEYKQSFDQTDDPLEQARRTVIRSFMGFGSNALQREIKSGFRSNSSRSGTTPALDWRNYPDVMDGMIERLRGVVIENAPAEKIITQHDTEQTLHYCDPPYVHDTRSRKMHGHHGYAHEMTDDDHRRLADLLRSVKGMVVLSGYPCTLYDELYSEWECVQREALADGARKRIECLWLSPATKARLHPTLFDS